MPSKTHVQVADVRGASRLAIAATVAVTDIVEAMHHHIARRARIVGAPPAGHTTGITRLVYNSIRSITQVVGGSLEVSLGVLDAGLNRSPDATSEEREAVRAALNGVVGDYLAATQNPLAIPFKLSAPPRPATGKVLVLVHGLCMNDRQWLGPAGHDHGAALARDLGYTPVYVHYNSGLHISENGRALAQALEDGLAHWPVPVEELVLVTHSMGGLVARSAGHYAAQAGHRWLRHWRKVFFLGTPHLGAPLERGGNWLQWVLALSPYTAPLGRLGNLRSAGITDLRYGTLVEDDWAARDRFKLGGRPRHAVPLPEGVLGYAMAVSLSRPPTSAVPVRAAYAPRAGFDGLVALDSALDPTLAIPPERQWVGHGLHHFDLLSDPAVYAQLRAWLTP